MDLTSDMLRGAYAYLAETPPFVEWNLPDAEDITFVVGQTWRSQGRCWPDEKQIMISAKFHRQTASLMATMAHEMVHLHQGLAKIKGKWHGKAFWCMAHEVCNAHGFDPGQF